MSDQWSPLCEFLRNRRVVENYAPETWSLLCAEARAANVLTRLAYEFDDPFSAGIPEELGRQLVAARRQAESLVADVRRELHQIDTAFAPLSTRVIYLKGAAYVAADLPAARGRLFSDIDVLVDKTWLAEAEARLMLAGWVAQPLSDYDRRYYREWSHEVPPMFHLHRGTTVDLHHSLVMPTCRIRVDVNRMAEAAVLIPGTSNRFRLCDEDLVLHAASHLLLNAEFNRGLRDLWDIDLLLRHFSGVTPDFAERVLVRAGEVGLSRIARQAFMLCQRFFATPLPPHAIVGEAGPVMWLLNQAIGTRHPDTRSRWQGLADETLLLREVRLRLPTHLLIRHLLHKAFAREPKSRKATV